MKKEKNSSDCVFIFLTRQKIIAIWSKGDSIHFVGVPMYTSSCSLLLIPLHIPVHWKEEIKKGLIASTRFAVWYIHVDKNGIICVEKVHSPNGDFAVDMPSCDWSVFTMRCNTCNAQIGINFKRLARSCCWKNVNGFVFYCAAKGLEKIK